MKKHKKIIYLSFALILLFSFCTNVSADSYLSYDNGVTCGNITNIPPKVPELVSMMINVVQVIVPVLLVIFGIIDLMKGVMSQKEDEIKKGRQTLIKRVIMGALVFLIILLVKFLVNFAVQNDTNRNNIINCINCFLNGECVG